MLKRVCLAVGLLLVATAPVPGAEPAAVYQLRYDVRVLPSQRLARVEIRIGKGAELVRSVRLRIDPERHVELRADGALTPEDGGMRWEVPAQGGALRYDFRIDRLRDAASYEARCADNWALFRGDDLVPPARVVSRTGSESDARLRLRLPDGWSVATPFERLDDGRFAIDQPERRFDRPTGWIVMGKLGVLRERVAGTRVVIAGPVGHEFRRHDLLALMRWTLPALRDAAGTLPERLLIVGAGDPMWRGGLSGPRSVFIHADRPLITSDLTSPVLHELVHAVMGARSAPGGDWVVEGLAELYSLDLLVRSKTVSRRREAKALRRMAERGRGVPHLDVAEASGAVTALAVTVLKALDREIAEASDGQAGLDDVLAELVRERAPISSARLRDVAERVAGRDLASFFRKQVPLRKTAKADP